MRLLTMSASAALLMLAGCGQPDSGDEANTAAMDADKSSVEDSMTTETEDAPDAMADAGGAPESFGQCAICHSSEAGANGIGPSLAGVFGSEAGHSEGFGYSEPLLGAGVTWDEESLDKWITNPAEFVPGNAMPFSGLDDEAARAEIIEYLKSI